MADIRCPNCGKDNPDFLSLCQFCQTPLTSESTLQIGAKPTKKTTGELEPVLPDWLKEVRKQARDSAEEEAAEIASMPKVQKDEPPDLLAGLASQAANTGEEDIPDWLSSLTSKSEAKPASTPAPAEPLSDYFARFSKSESAPENEPGSSEDPFRANNLGVPPSASPERDELTDWLRSTSEEPAEPFSLEPESGEPFRAWQEESRSLPPIDSSSPSQEEDLSWLRNLEEESKKTGGLTPPKQEGDWLSDFGASSTPAGSGEADDLSWLNQLGSLPAAEEPPSQSPQPKEDLSWLDDLGAPPARDESAPQTNQPKEDLSWLNSFESTPISDEPVQQPKEDLSWLNAFKDDSAPSQPEPSSSASQQDLSWLDQLGGTPGSVDSNEEQPAPQDDLSWLRDLQGSPDSPTEIAPEDSSPEQKQPGRSGGQPAELPHVSPFLPRQTAPLEDQNDSSVPDWLRSAAEEPSMPLGPQALDQFREDYNIPTTPEEPFSWKSFMQGLQPADEPEASSRPEELFVDPAVSKPASDAPSLSNQDVDSLFSVDMPDWLSQPEPAASEPVEEVGIHAESGEPLAPADLPSWVQAMRPVEAVISESGLRVEDQPAERDGPLAGFRGVIPVAPIGSSRRPHPIPLKLQATDEQQAGAEILEQILLGETTPRLVVSAPVVISQRMLRWAISALMLVVLGAIVLLRSQIMPVSAPVTSDVSNAVLSISENAPVLVILDYEPALAGEMEAASGPVLDQLVFQRHPHLSFLATSPNGTALVERLLANTGINQPDGYGYISGQDYINMGYLPGGEAGVLAFIESPLTAIPSSPVLGFSEYAAILLLTDHADSARVWVEQVHALKQVDPSLSGQPLLAVSSAQTGPMLQPYVSSRQVNGLVSGLAEAAGYEFVNNNRPGMARSYWDAFGAGVMLAVVLIVLGSLWSVFAGRSERSEHRVEAAEE